MGLCGSGYLPAWCGPDCAGLVAGSAKSIADATAAAGQLTVTSFLLGIIPTTVVDAFARGAILQVLTQLKQTGMVEEVETTGEGVTQWRAK